jgi:hypothetical protein
VSHVTKEICGTHHPGLISENDTFRRPFTMVIHLAEISSFLNNSYTLDLFFVATTGGLIGCFLKLSVSYAWMVFIVVFAEVILFQFA